jgi:hypothetical protein
MHISYRSSYLNPLAAVVLAALVAGATAVANATENGSSSYPVGVDTVLSAHQPARGMTNIYNYTNTYFANETDGANGKPSATPFKLRIGADAVKVVHDWGVPFLGGTLHSNIALPLVYQQIETPGGRGSKTALGNTSIAVLGTSYSKNNFSWYYEGDVFLPGSNYNKNDLANPGAHRWAGGPVAAVTYQPWHKSAEFSSKWSYLFNSANTATNYTNGQEFMWEYDAMKELNKHYAFGVNGFWYQQTSDDKQNGVLYNGGNRGRDFAVGPEVRIHFGKVGGALKYERDTLVQNRSRGSQLWFQFSVPLGHRK